MLKKIIHYLFYGISWGCICFVLTGLIGYEIAGSAWLEPVIADFPRQAFGSMLVGICCASSAIFYTLKRFPLWAAVLIHFGVGLGGFFSVAFWLGWMPLQAGWQVISFILIGVFSFVCIWAVFYFYNRHEAEKLNKRLRELEKEEEK